MLLPKPINENVRDAQRRIDVAARVSGRTGPDVTIVAATKYLDVDATHQLLAAGIGTIGESRLDAMLAKQQALTDAMPARWHFIGPLQSRKAREVAAHVACIETLCSESAARKLAAWADEGNALPQMLVQVNTAADPAKDGILPDALPAFLASLPDQLSVDGLMTMPAFAADAEASRPAFAQLRELAERNREAYAGRHPLRELSMGTSQDFDVAVEEGATLVRLGRILYAQRE